jgi:hypothetical protein
MTKISRTLVLMVSLALLLAVSSSSASAATHYYVVANNNTSPTNTVSVYQISGTSLVSLTTVPTGGSGSGGGYFAEVTQSIVLDGSNTCVFAGDAGSGDISAMKVIGTSPYLSVVGNYFSPDGDTASNFGLGITISGRYLYANYTGGTTPPAIGVWKIEAGCKLSFLTHLSTGGLNGGTIDGMAVAPTGKVLVAAYGDGSVGSYAIGDGSVSLIGQEMIAGNTVGAGAYAGSVAISSNGTWAIFGDFSPSNNTQLDVAKITSDGALSPTATYGGTGSLGSGVDTNGIQVSPDNRFIYVVDSYSGQETTVSFDTLTGVVTYPNACLTSLKGYNINWTFASQPATITPLGAGGGLYISEAFLTGDSYIALLQVNYTTGCATEVPNSPFVDTNGGNLESISAWSH